MPRNNNKLFDFKNKTITTTNNSHPETLHLKELNDTVDWLNLNGFDISIEFDKTGSPPNLTHFKINNYNRSVLKNRAVIDNIFALRELLRTTRITGDNHAVLKRALHDVGYVYRTANTYTNKAFRHNIATMLKNNLQYKDTLRLMKNATRAANKVKTKIKPKITPTKQTILLKKLRAFERTKRKVFISKIVTFLKKQITKVKTKIKRKK